MHMRNTRGFTLLEVLVAMMVFSVVLLGLGRMQVVALQVNRAASRLSLAMAVAQDKVEELMALPATDPQLADGTPPGLVTNHPLGPPDPNLPRGYTVTWTVDVNNPNVGLRTVNVRVAWKNVGKAKTITLAFIK